MSMTGKIEHVEVITSVRRRRWSAEEKAMQRLALSPGTRLELMGWTAPAERHRVPKVVVVV